MELFDIMQIYFCLFFECNFIALIFSTLYIFIQIKFIFVCFFLNSPYICNIKSGQRRRD